MKTWTFDGYWNTVLGATRTAADVVREFSLDPADRSGMGEWLDGAAEAARQAGGLADMPESWSAYHSRALDELERVHEVTDTDIADLQQAAARAGDHEQVRLCETALVGETDRAQREARAECERVIREARRS